MRPCPVKIFPDCNVAVIVDLAERPVPEFFERLDIEWPYPGAGARFRRIEVVSPGDRLQGGDAAVYYDEPGVIAAKLGVDSRSEPFWEDDVPGPVAEVLVSARILAAVRANH